MTLYWCFKCLSCTAYKLFDFVQLTGISTSRLFEVLSFSGISSPSSGLKIVQTYKVLLVSANTSSTAINSLQYNQVFLLQHVTWRARSALDLTSTILQALSSALSWLHSTSPAWNEWEVLTLSVSNVWCECIDGRRMYPLHLVPELMNKAIHWVECCHMPSTELSVLSRPSLGWVFYHAIHWVEYSNMPSTGQWIENKM